ncbi:MAG TPA: YCF48-related protein, partial [Gemmatimonadales bacterium]|nr:YCF48-related protein [Gemmatimonadales bacterium]
AQQVTEQQLLGPVEFRGLHAVSKQVVWASGSGGWVYHTTTGGAHWTIDTIPGATDLFLVDVWAKDARRAWVVGTDFRGGYAAIYGTTDGGATWTKQWELRDPAAFLDGLTCFSERECLAIGDPIGGNYLLLRTTDGGAHWDRVPVASLPPRLDNEAAFAASGTEITARKNSVWFVTGGGDHARVWRSRDRGLTWDVRATPLAAGSSAGLFGVAMQGDKEGLATGGDYQLATDSAANLLRTTDGGATWALFGRTTPIGVRWGLAAAGHGTYLATAPTGTGVTRDGGATWSALDAKPANTASCAGGVCWLAGRNRLAKVVF